jgi:hypothetical protein
MLGTDGLVLAFHVHTLNGDLLVGYDWYDGDEALVGAIGAEDSLGAEGVVLLGEETLVVFLGLVILSVFVEMRFGFGSELAMGDVRLVIENFVPLEIGVVEGFDPLGIFAFGREHTIMCLQCIRIFLGDIDEANHPPAVFVAVFHIELTGSELGAADGEVTKTNNTKHTNDH